MRQLIFLATLFLISCKSTNKVELSKESLYNQMNLIFRTDSSIKDYKSISFSEVDTVFFLDKEQRKIFLTYIQNKTKDTLLINQDQLIDYYKSNPNFGTEFTFSSRKDSLLKKTYAGLSYNFSHTYTTLSDTIQIQLKTDTNWNILRKEVIQK